jgi:hypothetical protein
LAADAAEATLGLGFLGPCARLAMAGFGLLEPGLALPVRELLRLAEPSFLFMGIGRVSISWAKIGFSFLVI